MSLVVLGDKTEHFLAGGLPLRWLRSSRGSEVLTDSGSAERAHAPAGPSPTGVPHPCTAAWVACAWHET